MKVIEPSQVEWDSSISFAPEKDGSLPVVFQVATEWSKRPTHITDSTN